MIINEAYVVLTPTNPDKVFKDSCPRDPSFPFKPCFVGIEVECERVSLSVNALKDKGFYVKDDYSLRNSGKEITTPPIPSDRAVTAFKTILDSLGPKADFSKRTSIHVHFDCTSLSMEEVKRIVYLYTIFEKALFGFCRPEREKSVFCLPLTDTLCALQNSLSFMIDNWGKYSSLNLCTLPSFGTIEFRHLEGTGDVEKFRRWFYLLHSIYSARNSFGDSTRLLREIFNLNTNSNYLSFAHTVFGDNLQYIEENLLESMVKGVKYLKLVNFSTFAFKLAYENLVIKPASEKAHKAAKKHLEEI